MVLLGQCFCKYSAVTVMVSVPCVITILSALEVLHADAMIARSSSTKSRLSFIIKVEIDKSKLLLPK